MARRAPLGWLIYVALLPAFVAGLFFGLMPVASAQTATPRITSISPSSGPIGTRVTVIGTGLSGAAFVSFGPGVVPIDAATATVPSDTRFTFTIPQVIIPQCTFANPPCPTSIITPSPAIYAVSAATDPTLATVSNSLSFTVTPTVVITSITPTQGQVGTVVTITGRGFSTSTNSINFDTGSTQGIIPQTGGSATMIKFAIPQYLFPRCAIQFPSCPVNTYKPSTGAYSISVAPDFNFSQISNALPFTLNSGSVTSPAPVITSITPNAGTIGTQVTVKGINFSPNLNVIDFGNGLVLPTLSGNDLVFTIPQSLVSRCVFFNNPPCSNPQTTALVPGTYNITVAASPSLVSAPMPFTVSAIPLPTTPPAMPTSTVSSQVKATAGINVRSDALISASIVGTEAAGSTGFVLGGPIAASGYQWYQVAWSDGIVGWSAGTYLAPVSLSYCPITIGDAVYTFVTGEQQALTLYTRSNPSLQATISGAEPAGAQAKILNGPTIADGYNWWNLKFPDGTVGWVTENNFVDASCVKNSTSTPTLPQNLQGPSVTFTAPLNGATVSGQVPLTVTVSSGYTVTSVDFYRDNILIGTATAAPYTVKWDATQVNNGAHTLKAHANTSAGVSAESSISVNVTGGITAPLVNFTTPKNGDTVSGQVPLTVSISSTLTITGVDFYWDNALVGTVAQAPYTTTFDATKVVNGYHTLRAIAHTAQGPVGSAIITVSVTGGIPPQTTPTIDVMFITPQNGATISGQVPVTVAVSSTDPIANVSFYLDGQPIGTAAAAPYTITLDATQVLNGRHTLLAIAKSTTGYTGNRAIVVNVTGGLSYPTVTFTTPLNSATVSGQVPLTVAVPVNRPAVTEVDFYADGVLVGKATTAPYTVTWDATQVYNGSHGILAVARTTNTTISGNQSIVVNVTGGLVPPAVSVKITTPQNGSTVFGKVQIAATVSSSIPITGMDFSENGTVLGTVTGAPYTFTWDATLVTPGTYSITARAKTATVSVGASISVNVIAPPIFFVGEQVRVQTDSQVGLNVRSGASTQYAIVGTEPNGAIGTILNSIPVFANNYNWWQVKYADGVTGWSAESYLTAAQ